MIATLRVGSSCALPLASQKALKRPSASEYHIEHFDEKLDEYLKEGIAGHILPEYVGLMREPDGVPVHHFRAYYLDTGTFEMLGKRYDVQPIVEELSRIHEVLITCGTTSRERENRGIHRKHARLSDLNPETFESKPAINGAAFIFLPDDSLFRVRLE